ncbi:MAG: YtxH domain-containing protein [Sediminibacterium sp.]|jgi:gas vesicle protein
MSENNKFISGLLLGALAGTALALYLNSDKGKELLASLNVEADHIKEEAQEGYGHVKESVDDLLVKAKNLVKELEQKIAEA